MKWQEYLHITRGDLFLAVVLHSEHILLAESFTFQIAVPGGPVLHLVRVKSFLLLPLVLKTFVM